MQRFEQGVLYGFVGVQTLGLELPGFNQFGSVQSLEQGVLYGFVGVQTLGFRVTWIQSVWFGAELRTRHALWFCWCTDTKA